MGESALMSSDVETLRGGNM